jgi:hypothetical protein
VTAIASPERLRACIFQLSCTAAATEAGDTLNVYVQHSWDGGTTFDDFVSFTQIAGNTATPFTRLVTWARDGMTPESEMRAKADAGLAAGSVLQGPMAGYWRVKWVIVDSGNANQSFTFSLVCQPMYAQGDS